MPQKLIPTLHNLSHSGAFRCLWALEELKEANGTEYVLKNYDRQRGAAPPELKAVSPLGKSPILTLEPAVEGEGEGEAPPPPPPTIQLKPGVLTEAQLILRFLSDEYGGGLWAPESAEDGRRDVFFQGFAAMTLVPKMDVLIFLELVSSLPPFGLSHLIRYLLVSPLVSRFKSEVRPMLQVLEDALGEKPWFAGGKLGLADFNVCWGVDLASQRGYLDPEKFPRTAAWHTRVKARSGYARALEKGNGYDLKTFGV